MKPLSRSGIKRIIFKPSKKKTKKKAEIRPKLLTIKKQVCWLANSRFEKMNRKSIACCLPEKDFSELITLANRKHKNLCKLIDGVKSLTKTNHKKVGCYRPSEFSLQNSFEPQAFVKPKSLSFSGMLPLRYMR